MPRPKTGLPTKQRMNLTVSAEVRDYLNQLSQVLQQSVSEIISQYAEQEIKKLNRKQGKAKTAAPEQTTRAAKKTEQRIMDLAPFAILIYVGASSPEFLAPLYGNPLGVCVMTVCLLTYAGAFLLAEKILDIRI